MLFLNFLNEFKLYNLNCHIVTFELNKGVNLFKNKNKTSYEGGW